MREHDLKVIPPYFDAIEAGLKNFEIRLNDRGYKVGDILNLQEYLPIEQEYTGRASRVEVTYVLHGANVSWLGLEDGFVGMAIKKVISPAFSCSIQDVAMDLKCNDVRRDPPALIFVPPKVEVTPEGCKWEYAGFTITCPPSLLETMNEGAPAKGFYVSIPIEHCQVNLSDEEE